MKCVGCEKQDLIPERIDVLESVSTMAFVMPFIDKEGKSHIHNTNRTTQALRCSNQHRFERTEPHTCWCGWKQEIS